MTAQRQTERERRGMALIAFMQAQNCSNYPGSWRHPETRGNFLSSAYYMEIARVLEAGKFHMAFFDDRLAMPDTYGGGHAETVAHGIRAVKLDPIPVASMMAATTRHLGLGATGSTTYHEPFHIARVFATLDHLSGGRAAWNIVTSLNDSEAANFGASQHLAHDLRYDRADEFLEIVLGHWHAWAEDARAPGNAGRFADPARVKRLDHVGKFFSSRGPFTLPRSPQGHPVLLQAGQSGRGLEFAARWAELVFTIQPTITGARRFYARLKEKAAALGRDPDALRLAPACYVIAAESRGEAAEKCAAIDALARPEDGLVLLSEVLNFDFSRKPLDAPFSDAELAAITGLQAFRDRVVAETGKSHPSLRDFLAVTGRGTLREFSVFVGAPNDIADEMEAWFKGEACDGFVIAATHMPGAYEDFARLVVPELQRRGLFHHGYRGATLRETLGLPRAMG